MMSRIPRIGSAYRAFSTTPMAASNIGKLPIKINDSVQCFVEEIPMEFCKTFTKGKETYLLKQQIIMKGPKGVLKTDVPKFVNIANEDNTITVSVQDPTNRIQRSMWGTTRALLQNNFIGASEGHLAIVKFVGTCYRATLEDGVNGKKYVALKIGYPYTPKVLIPEGVTVTSPNPTRLLIEGPDKQQVKLFAAVIRKFKKPEPYKGKGIFVDDETIKLKEKKIK